MGDEPCNRCLDHAEIVKSIKMLEDLQKDLDLRIRKLEVNEGRRDEKIDNILEIVKDLKSKLETLSTEPIKRLNNAKSNAFNTVINVILGIILAFIFYKLTGLKF